MSIARNTIYNLASTLLPIGISLVTIPVYLHLIGLERYGVLSTCWLLLGYFGLFDLGLGRAVSQRIAALVSAPDEARNTIFWTAFWLSVILMLVASALLLPIAHYLLHLIKFETVEVASEVDRAAPWLAMTLPVSLLTGIINGALTGRERFGLLGVSEIISNSLGAVVPLIFAYFVGTQLWVLIAASLMVKVFSTGMMFAFCRAVVPLKKPVRPDRVVAVSLMTYGGWVSVTSIVGPMLAIWDRFAVGWYLGAAAVSAYVIPFTFVMRLTLIPSALSRALFPRFASLAGSMRTDLHRDSIAALALVMTPATIAGIWLSYPFLSVWLGTDLATSSAPIMVILLPGVWFNGIAQIVYSFLQAKDQPSIVAKIHLVELIPYLVVLFAAMYWFGLPGVAAASTIRNIMDALLLFNSSDDGIAILRPFVPSVAILFLAAVVALVMPAAGLVTFGLLMLMTVIGVYVAYLACPMSLRSILTKSVKIGLRFRRAG